MSIRGRVTLAMIATSVGFVLAACVALVLLIAAQLESDARTSAEQSATSVAQAADTTSSVCSQIRVSTSSRSTDQWIVVVDAAGDEACRSNVSLARSTAELRRVEPGSSRRLQDRSGRDVVAAAREIANGHVVAVRAFDAQSMINRLLVASGIVIAVAAFIAVLLGSALAARATRDVTGLMGDIRDAVLDPRRARRLGRRSDAQLDDLATGFNDLLDQVDDGARAQRQLVLDAAHQLRTPLTSLSSNVELLQATGGASDETPIVLADVSRQTRALAELVNDLIDVASVQERVREVDASATCQLDDAVRAVAQRIRELHPQRTIQLSTEPAVVRGDAQLIIRAIVNLVDNSLTHGPAGGGVSLRQSGGSVRIEDDGAGIAPEQLEQLAQPFRRGRAARQGSGTGLGLTFAARVAEAFGGSLRSAASTDADRAYVELELLLLDAH